MWGRPLSLTPLRMFLLCWSSWKHGKLFGWCAHHWQSLCRAKQMHVSGSYLIICSVKRLCQLRLLTLDNCSRQFLTMPFAWNSSLLQKSLLPKHFRPWWLSDLSQLFLQSTRVQNLKWSCCLRQARFPRYIYHGLRNGRWSSWME